MEHRIIHEAKCKRARVGQFVCVLMLVFPAISSAGVIQLIDNGGFESGLSNWSVQGSASVGVCSIGSNPWVVSNIGCSGLNAPVYGTSAVYGIWEGVGPAIYQLQQQFSVPGNISSATLSWAESAIWNPPGDYRSFTIDIYDSTLTNRLTVPYTENVGAGPGNFISWRERVVTTEKLNNYAGQDLILAFTLRIRDEPLGSGAYGLDNISLVATTHDAPSSVPEPTTLALLALGLAGIGYRRKKQNNKPKWN